MVGIMNTALAIVLQLIQSVLLIAIAPIFTGWIHQNRAWLNNKKGPGIFQPYRQLHKLLLKDSLIAHNASHLFRMTPYIYFGAMCLITAIIPVLSTSLPFAPVADVIALVALFSFARIFLALAAMDIGTAFGSMGARREMLISFLAEPALLMVFFNVAFIHQSTSLATIVSSALTHTLTINPSISFAALAFVMVLLAENARIPVDNPTTHLELTMTHEAMILEYSGRHLALLEWASHLKLLNYVSIGLALFFPWGTTTHLIFTRMGYAGLFFLLKLCILGIGLAIFEVITVKVRLFRVPEFLTIAFLLSILGVLTQLLDVR